MPCKTNIHSDKILAEYAFQFRGAHAEGPMQQTINWLTNELCLFRNII